MSEPTKIGAVTRGKAAMLEELELARQAVQDGKCEILLMAWAYRTGEGTDYVQNGGCAWLDDVEFGHLIGVGLADYMATRLRNTGVKG